jgi:hypothetical protein
MERPSRKLPTTIPNADDLNPEQRYHGVRTVASASIDATDCALLLEALGLDPTDGVIPPDEQPP